MHVQAIQSLQKLNFVLVPVGGLEPPRIAATDFESVVSTIPPHGHADLVQ